MAQGLKRGMGAASAGGGRVITAVCGAAFALGAGSVAALAWRESLTEKEDEGAEGVDGTPAEGRGVVRYLRGAAGGRSEVDRSSVPEGNSSGSVHARPGGSGLVPSTVDPVASRFTDWIKGPVMHYSQVPVACAKATLVNGGASARIWAAEQSMDASAAETERMAARSFTNSATAYAAMISELVTEARGAGCNANADKKEAVGKAMKVGTEFTKAAYESALASDAVIAAASDEVASAIKSSLGASQATQAALLRMRWEKEKSGVDLGMPDLAISRAALSKVKETSQVTRRGVAVVKKAQEARTRLRALLMHNSNVFAASKIAERAIAMEITASAVGGRKGDEASTRAAVALKRLLGTIEAALECSRDGLAAIGDGDEQQHE